MDDEKQPNLLQIIFSLLASFFGVQSKKNLARDEAYIEQHGIKVYVLIGFFLVFCLLLTLFGIVKLILYFAQ